MTNVTAATFQPIPNFPGYEVNRAGQVRRLTNGGGGWGTRGWPKGRKVRGWQSSNQRIFHLWRDGKVYDLTAVQLVGKTFGIPRADLVDYARGERVTVSKLKAADIPEIRGLHRQGMATEKIGPLFGVSGRTIRDVINRRTWRHIL